MDRDFLFGVLGTPSRMEYTVLGHTANLAARLCGAAAAGEILTTEQTYAAAREQRTLYGGATALPHLGFASKGRMPFKNVAEPIEVIAVSRKQKGADVPGRT